jgi:GAF domain-containing protein
MRRSFFKRRNLEEKKTAPTSKLTLQTSLLNNLLIGIIILGCVSFVANMPNVLASGWFASQIVYGLGIVWLFVILKVKRFSYRARVYSFLSVVAIIGLVALFTEGLTSSARLFLLMLPFFSVLFLGRREAFLALVICGLSMMAAVAAVHYQFIPNPDPVALNRISGLWLDSIVNFFLVAVPMTISVSAIITGLGKSLESEGNLLSQLKEEQSLLAEQVAEHTRNIQYRLVQIRTAAEITQAINQLVEPEELLAKVVELVKERFDLYYVGVFLLEESRTGLRKFASLRAGSGDAGRQMLNAGHKLAVENTSMVGWAILNQKARVAQDTGNEAVHFNNPFLPLTRSELALPLVSGERVLGALTVQSTKPSAFDDDDITVLKGIADGLATALENTRLFYEAKRNLEEVRTLNRQYLQQAWSLYAERKPDLNFTYVDEQDDQQARIVPIKLPLSLRDQVIGEIILEREDSILTEEEQAFIEAVTNQAVLALENARLLDATQRRAGTERLVADITRKVRASNELEAIMRITIQELGRVLQASEGIIRLEGQEFDDSPHSDSNVFETIGPKS